MQCRLIRDRAMKHSFHWLLADRQALELKQSFRRQDPCHTNLVIYIRHIGHPALQGSRQTGFYIAPSCQRALHPGWVMLAVMSRLVCL
jgi:hypothetical protein